MREQGVGEVYAGLDDASRQKDKDSRDGISLVTTYGYDNLNRLNKVTYPLGNTVTYSYDPMGNRMSMVTKLGRSSSTTSYNYDAADELLSAGSTTYAYDNNGNRITKNESGMITSYGYDAANRLSSVTLSRSFGHRMSGPDGSVRENDIGAPEDILNDKDANISRDSLNEKDTDTPKNSLKENNADTSRNSLKEKKQTTVYRYTYDGDGNRIGKSVTLNKRTDSTQYLWDINHGLPQVLTESDGKGTALFTYGLGRISMADPRQGQIYYQYDGQGSVRSLTDRKGMTRGLYAYDAFGKPLISASPVDNDFQYTGEQVDDETGLIYLRSRYYDPETGRFISRDPFAGFDTNSQSLNRYTYVQNNPVVYSDPSGKVPYWAVGGLIGACANTGWYIGEQAAIQYKTGNNQFSFSTLGGRAVGGFVGGSVATAILTYQVTNPVALAAQPYAAGAAAGSIGYTFDRGTQAVLSNLGLGRAEPGTWEGLGVSTAAGTLSGGIAVGTTNTIIPASNAIEQKVLRTGYINSFYKENSVGMNVYVNNNANSNQGPVRMGSGYISGGKLY
jgi:RHS repeat-associated protein